MDKLTFEQKKKKQRKGNSGVTGIGFSLEFMTS